MAYTSVIPVHRLDRSIEYVKDKEKTTQKADSLEAAIDYAMNRTKTEHAWMIAVPSLRARVPRRIITILA